MNFKAAALAVLSCFTVGVTAPAQAKYETGSFDEHTELYNTIHSYGVRVFINHPEYCDGKIDGSYISTLRVLNVCQDNGRPGGPEVEWTANDLDTLRHEAHHMIQDCAGAGHGNGHLVHLFSHRPELLQFVDTVYSRDEQRMLMGNDSYQGHNGERQLIELEAFATARVISATDIKNKMVELCRAR